MSKFEYVGRAGRFVGKSLPQICLRLKDLGVGRMFIRSTYKRYKEVTYYILTKSEPDMSDEFMRLGSFKADVVFRGSRCGNLELPGYKEDFQLVPKDMEKHYLEQTLPGEKKWREPTKVPKFVDLPPMLKQILIQECIDKQVKFDEKELNLPVMLKSKNFFSNFVQE